jgi:hypothetical protein
LPRLMGPPEGSSCYYCGSTTQVRSFCSGPNSREHMPSCMEASDNQRLRRHDRPFSTPYRRALLLRGMIGWPGSEPRTCGVTVAHGCLKSAGDPAPVPFSDLKRIERIVVASNDINEWHARDDDGDDFGSAGGRVSRPPAPARNTTDDRGERDRAPDIALAGYAGAERPTDPPGRPRSRCSSATSALGCVTEALQRNGYTVTRRCIATVAPRQPSNGVPH